MIRFDREQLPPPAKPPLLAGFWFGFGGFYPFLPPVAWALAPYALLARLDELTIPAPPAAIHGWQLAEGTYTFALSVWFLGFAPLAWLCSLLYRANSAEWWNQQEARTHHPAELSPKLAGVLLDGERPLGAATVDPAGIAGAGPADVVLVVSSLVASLGGLVLAAILPVLVGTDGLPWGHGTLVGFILLMALRTVATPPSMTVLFTSFVPLMLLISVRQVTGHLLPDIAIEVVPLWVVWMAALGALVALCRLARASKLKLACLLFTGDHLVGLRRYRLRPAELVVACKSGGPRAMVQQWWAAQSAIGDYRMGVEWPDGGELHLTRTRWSDVVTVVSPRGPRRSMHLRSRDGDELPHFIAEHDLPWRIVDRRTQPAALRRCQASVAVDAFVAIAVAVGAAQVTAGFVGSAMTVHHVLLPTLDAAKQGDAVPYESLLPVALAARPNDPLVWLHKAQAAETLGRVDDAVEAWRRTAELTKGEGKVGRAAEAAAQRLSR